jgi:hypothetical protein
MKILNYTGFRTGSRSFGEWLSIELNLLYYHEPFNPIFDIKNFSIEDAGDCIIKIPPTDGFDYENLKKLFDKKIVLYRENTREQSESIIWANEKQLWHNTWHNSTENSSFKSAHYTIPQDWLDKNAESIKSMELRFEKENKELKLLKDCLHITYEELYYSNKGIKKVEDYIEFKSKSTFNKINKLRNGKIEFRLI